VSSANLAPDAARRPTSAGPVATASAPRGSRSSACTEYAGGCRMIVVDHYAKGKGIINARTDSLIGAPVDGRTFKRWQVDCCRHVMSHLPIACATRMSSAGTDLTWPSTQASARPEPDGRLMVWIAMSQIWCGLLLKRPRMRPHTLQLHWTILPLTLVLNKE
jgi:hypothetical protein